MPSWTIVSVLSMFSTSFWAVPALSRVLPAMTSGPTRGTMLRWHAASSGEAGVQATAIVAAPRARARRTAATTNGVRPLAAIPTTTSSGPAPRASIARSPAASSSSAPSTASVTACASPASTACTRSGGVPNVGGHSAASSTPSRPLVPAPT